MYVTICNNYPYLSPYHPPPSVINPHYPSSVVITCRLPLIWFPYNTIRNANEFYFWIYHHFCYSHILFIYVIKIHLKAMIIFSININSLFCVSVSVVTTISNIRDDNFHHLPYTSTPHTDSQVESHYHIHDTITHVCGVLSSVMSKRRIQSTARRSFRFAFWRRKREKQTE